MAAEVYKNYIGGEWVAAQTGETFENRNPVNTDDVIGVFQKSDERDVAAAVAAAREAQKAWALVPAPHRAEVLLKASLLLRERKEEYARVMTREMGKILKETRGDIQEAIDTCDFYFGEGRRYYGQTTPSELRDKFCMTVRQPMGVCALITPWNFPMAIPSWKTLPALLCGNAVVIKPATDTPASVVHLVRCLEEAGVPKGVVNMVTGSGTGVGTPLLRHDDVNLVSFTGSSEVGAIVEKECAGTFKRISLEMGGKNVIIVMDDANLDNAVEGALWGAFGTTGQRCTASSRLVLHKKIYNQFAERFVERAKALKVGDGLDESVEMGPSINEAQLQKVMEYVEIGRREDGARLLCGGSRLTGGAYDKGFFHEPTVLGDCAPGMRTSQEEIFGPVVSLIPAENLEDAIAIANGVEYGLSASIYTQDVNAAYTAMRDVYTGIFYVNSSTIGAEVHLPFGGTKNTGNGHREAGETVLDIFSEWKAVYVDFSGKLQKAQIDVVE